MAKIKIDRESSRLERNKIKVERLRPGQAFPSFASLFGDAPADPTPNPLDDLEYTGDPQADSDNEISATLQAIIDEKRQRRDQYRDMLDTEFWFCVCFQNREQKEKFLTLMGLADLGDKYLDGLAVAQRLSIDIPAIPLTIKQVRQAPKALREGVIRNERTPR